MPYRDIVSTLIHELSHNWVSEHDLMFWTNFGQMRVEYLHRHASMAASGTLVDGKTTSDLAGVSLPGGMKSIAGYVMKELEKDMAQHGLHPRMIAHAILERCQQLTEQFEKSEQGQRVWVMVVLTGAALFIALLVEVLENEHWLQQSAVQHNNSKQNKTKRRTARRHDTTDAGYHI